MSEEDRDLAGGGRGGGVRHCRGQLPDGGSAHDDEARGGHEVERLDAHSMTTLVGGAGVMLVVTKKAPRCGLVGNDGGGRGGVFDDGGGARRRR